MIAQPPSAATLHLSQLQSLFAIISLCLLLSACSGSRHTIPQPLLPLAANSALQNWKISGKIGLRTNSDAHSAYINWHQCGDSFDIRLSGPLGQGSARLLGNRIGVRLQTQGEEAIYAASAEQLMEQYLGWSLPVSQLAYWMRGIPSPHFTFEASDTGQHFSQQGWQLDFPKLTQIDGYQLPSKTTAEQAPYKVSLLIKDWQLQPDCPLQ